MNMRWFWVPALLLLTSIGCRQDPYMQVYLDSLNAEKRMLEDRVYELEYNYEQKLCELEAARQYETDDQADSGSSVLRDSRSTRPGRPTESRPPRDGMPPGIPDLSPPSVDPGTPAGGGSRDGGEEEDVGPLNLEMGEEADKINAVPPLPDDLTVTHLYLHPALTGGDNSDDKPGDDGVSVAFEPRNVDKQFVPLPARVSVVLLDPANRSRVARWDFNADDVALAIQQARSGRGIRLRMPWKGPAPEETRLHMFVRYWTKDGKAIEADREISIQPANHLASRWTPRSETRPRSVDVAEKPPVTDQPASASRPSDDSSTPAGPVPKQAQRPQWRPYR
jgi:hypothetical protein